MVSEVRRSRHAHGPWVEQLLRPTSVGAGALQEPRSEQHAFALPARCLRCLHSVTSLLLHAGPHLQEARTPNIHSRQVGLMRRHLGPQHLRLLS